MRQQSRQQPKLQQMPKRQQQMPKQESKLQQMPKQQQMPKLQQIWLQSKLQQIRSKIRQLFNVTKQYLAGISNIKSKSSNFCPLLISIYVLFLIICFLGMRKLLTEVKNNFLVPPNPPQKKIISGLNKTYIDIRNGQKFELSASDHKLQSN